MARAKHTAVFVSPESDEKDDSCVDRTLQLRQEELLGVKQKPMLTRVVDQGKDVVVFFAVEVRVDLPVKDAQEDYRHAREDYVVKLNEPLVEDGHGTEAAKVCVEVVRHRQSHIFVEEIQDEACDACVACPSMQEDQSPQFLKLRYRKV